MTAEPLGFLLLKSSTREPISQAEMQKTVLRDNQAHFPVVFSMYMKEVDPREHIYIMVPTMGLTYDVMLNSGQGLPRAGLLVLVLSLIMWNADHAPEEKIWGALSRMGVCVESEHCNFGEPRELLTHTWVQEGYLAYRQVPDSHPARSEFLWVPQAYAETSKWEVMAFLLRVKGLRGPSHPCLQRLQGRRTRRPEPEQHPGDPSLCD